MVIMVLTELEKAIIDKLRDDTDRKYCLCLRGIVLDELKLPHTKDVEECSLDIIERDETLSEIEKAKKKTDMLKAQRELMEEYKLSGYGSEVEFGEKTL